MIPMVDLKAQYRSIKDEVNQAMQGVIEASQFIGGEELKQFEKEFANYCDLKYSCGCSSGTDALYLAIRASGIGKGDIVITTPFTFIATAEAITLCGAGVKFIDIDPDTYCIDPNKLDNYLKKASKISGSGSAKALIPVHLYGHPVDMKPIMEIAREYELIVIEDCAQAHGARYRGKRVGSIGNVGCFSFFPGKNLGAYGDAGIVVSNDENLIKNIRMLANHGRKEKYKHFMEGTNSRLDNLQAAILRVKLKHLERWNEFRRERAERYSANLKNIDGVKIPINREWAEHVYHLYVILFEKRDRLSDILKNAGFSSAIHYPIPLHLQSAYKYLNIPQNSLPVAEEVARRCLSLPMYPELDFDKIDEICEIIKNHVG